MIETPRLLLRPWRDSDRQPFAAMNADPEVARHQKLDRYTSAFESDGLSRWVIEGRESAEFLGYAGLLHHTDDHPAGDHFDLAWRLRRTAWGQGYATEAASAALKDASLRVGLIEALAYTSPDNLRSQSVMARLGLHRDPSRDFTATDERLRTWIGLVWVTRRAASSCESDNDEAVQLAQDRCFAPHPLAVCKKLHT